MYWGQPVEYVSRTDVGLRRRNNEDACTVKLCADAEEFAARGHLFVVADGMGGHAVGELASKMAVDLVPHTFFKSQQGGVRDALRAAIELANESINDRGTRNRDFQRMGTTCTTLALTSQGAVVGHVGDSRAYRVRGERVDQLTRDHSLHWELQTRKPRSETEALLRTHRNVITRCLGPEPTVEVDVEGPFVALPGDVYVLCSDGLTARVEDDEIAAIAQSLAPREAAKLLVNLSNVRGGPDNCTVVIARVGGAPGNFPPPETSDADDRSLPLGWGWLLAFSVIGLGLVAGLSLTVLGRPLIGSVLSILFGTALVALVVMLMEQQRKWAEQQAVPDPSATRIARPYRSAVAKPLSELVEELVLVCSELRQTATEDAWNVDQAILEEQLARGGKAADKSDHEAALGEYAAALDLLMGGFLVEMRQGRRPRPESTQATLDPE